MDDLEKILDDCLEEIASGASSLEACLVRYPHEASELEPLLRTAVGFGYGREVHPSPGFKGRTRTELVRYMQAHPRGGTQRTRPSAFASWQVLLIVGMLLIFLLMASGTAYAQSAVPGDPFYGWKLTSERVWRGLSSDRVGTDLVLAERRVDEYLAVAGDPSRRDQALRGYGEVLLRLRSETDGKTRGRIVPALEHHALSLKDSGTVIPQLDELILEQTGTITSPASSPDGQGTGDPGNHSGAGSAPRQHPEKPAHP